MRRSLTLIPLAGAIVFVVALTLASSTYSSGPIGLRTTAPISRNESELSSIGPSSVTTSGRQVTVRKRNQDGTLATPFQYVIRGVAWSPASQNTLATTAGRRAEFVKWKNIDIPLIKAMNVNTVYTYLDPELDEGGLSVLDQLYDNGLMVVMTVDESGSYNLTRLRQAVLFFKNHPAILAWSIGNEWNINTYHNPNDSVLGAAIKTELAARLIKSLDPNHPVATSLGDIDINNIGRRLSDIENYVNNVCPTVDWWGLNVYRGNTFGPLFDQWKAISSKPMFLGEFGTDVFRSTNSLEHPPKGSIDLLTQTEWVLSEWNHLSKNLSALNQNNVALGGFVFEWNDEWWKVLEPAPGTQSTDGCDSNNCDGHPDHFANEEFFGIVDINRNVRPIFDVLKNAFLSSYQAPQSLGYRVISRGGAVPEEYPFQLGGVIFLRDGEIFYRRDGGDLQALARGFNIAVIDPCTNTLIQPVQHFDTYNAAHNGGPELNQLISFLDSIPIGAFVMIAVADDAGLTDFPPNNCTQLPANEPLLQRLETLGSTKIRNYCFRNSWAMIAVNGTGSARSEQLGSGIEVTAQSPLSLSARITPSSMTFAAPGGAGSVNVEIPTTCGWTATSNSSFISITSSSTGTGNGSVNFSVSPNSGAVRTGSLSIAGQKFSVVQQSGCQFSVSPLSQQFAANGGVSTVNVSTSSVCSWTATSNVDIIRIQTSPTGDGNGVVQFAVSENLGAVQRIGTATIAGQRLTINQTAATFSLQLVTEENGPDPNQIAALDSLLLLRDPFPIVNTKQILANQGTDRNTRLLFFVKNLQLAQGETANAVRIHLIDAFGQTFDGPAEDVRTMPNSDFTQVKFRLPDNLTPGICTVWIEAHAQLSNQGFIRIAP